MAKVLVYCEHNDGKIKKGSLEVLTNVKSWGAETHAIVLGSGLDALTDELKEHGADTIHQVDAADVSAYSPQGFAAAVAGAAKETGADVLLASMSARSKDFFPRAAVKLDTAMASDCIELSLDGDTLKAKRPLYAGKVIGAVEFKGAKPYIATVRGNALGMKDKQAGAGNVNKLSPDLGTIAAKVSEVVKGDNAGKVDLTEAERIVSGGRSLQNAENFKILEELAEVIGASVGASRAAVDAGYRPHPDQVGQTGKTVSPSLYMAFGISGAIQHLAGMRTSKVIVAINTDDSAPIFQKADYGMKADLFEAAPALTAEFKKLLNK